MIQIIIAALQDTAGITLRNITPSTIRFAELRIALIRRISSITMKSVLEILLFFHIQLSLRILITDLEGNFSFIRPIKVSALITAGI